MSQSIQGLHHITAVSGPPAENFKFYRNILGLRFTKKTVNFDDPFTYHLYYGNYHASPGSSITFFPWQHVPDGSPNAGEATSVQYSIPDGAMSYWKERFKKSGVDILSTTSRFGYSGLQLKDNDGMNIELTEDPNSSFIETKGYSGVADEQAIRGFFGTTLSLADTGKTSELIREFGWQLVATEGGVTRYSSQPDNNLGRFIDLKKEPELNGRFGRGSIHHIAFRVPDDNAQSEWREKLIEMGYQVTPVQNREYFRSIYFREHGGVLFEIATDIPGFTKDEELENLGMELQLPAWYEKHREEIEKQLPELET
jgi:glyoxalase family protein